MEGKVKNYKSDKGFGFIQGTDGVDAYFRKEWLDAKIKGKGIGQGDKVSYDLEDGPRGPQAKNIKILEKGPKETKPQSIGAEWTISESTSAPRQLLVTITFYRGKNPVVG